MSLVRTVLIVLIVLDIALCSEHNRLLAQIRKSPKSAEFKRRRIPPSKAAVMCPILKKTKYPYHGIGIKLGDPIGITYKFYLDRHWAFGGSAGFAASGLYSHYYKNAFKEYIPKSLTLNQSMSYLSHKVPTDWSFQAKALYQMHIDALFKGLQVYVGLGWQSRVTSLDYTFTFSENDPVTGRNKILNFITTRYTHGVLGILGFEYAYLELPLAAFLEVEVMTDVFLDPGHVNFQGSIGVRYIF